MTTTPARKIGLAPMSGYTDDVMRETSLRWGADFAYSQMFSSRAVLRGDTRCRLLLPESLAPVQIFGSDPIEISQAATMIEHRASWIDLNAACPVNKVTRKGAGASLLKNPSLIRSILEHLKGCVNVPISLKMRLGWSENNIIEILDDAAKASPDIVIIHGRTARQGYSGKSDWNAIDAAVRHLEGTGITVYGSGDLFTPEDIVRAMTATSVTGVVVARGAVGNPWIFSQAKDLMEFGSYRPISVNERVSSFLKHLEELVNRSGEATGIRVSRKLFAGYTRGIRYATEIRRRFMKLETLHEIQALLRTLLLS